MYIFAFCPSEVAQDGGLRLRTVYLEYSVEVGRKDWLGWMRSR